MFYVNVNVCKRDSMFITSNKVTYPVYKQKSVLDNNKSNTKKVIASTATIIGVAACVKNKKTLVKIVKNKISEIKKLLCKNSKNKYPTVYSIKPEIKKTLKDIFRLSPSYRAGARR